MSLQVISYFLSDWNKKSLMTADFPCSNEVNHRELTLNDGITVAQVVCLTCWLQFCEQCAQEHSNSRNETTFAKNQNDVEDEDIVTAQPYREHEMKSLAQLRISDIKNQNDLLTSTCPDHGQSKLRHYCTICETFACAMCVAASHNNHVGVLLSIEAVDAQFADSIARWLAGMKLRQREATRECEKLRPLVSGARNAEQMAVSRVENFIEEVRHILKDRPAGLSLDDEQQLGQCCSRTIAAIRDQATCKIQPWETVLNKDENELLTEIRQAVRLLRSHQPPLSSPFERAELVRDRARYDRLAAASSSSQQLAREQAYLTSCDSFLYVEHWIRDVLARLQTTVPSINSDPQSLSVSKISGILQRLDLLLNSSSDMSRCSCQYHCGWSSANLTAHPSDRVTKSPFSTGLDILSHRDGKLLLGSSVAWPVRLVVCKMTDLSYVTSLQRAFTVQDPLNLYSSYDRLDDAMWSSDGINVTCLVKTRATTDRCTMVVSDERDAVIVRVFKDTARCITALRDRMFLVDIHQGFFESADGGRSWMFAFKPADLLAWHSLVALCATTTATSTSTISSDACSKVSLVLWTIEQVYRSDRAHNLIYLLRMYTPVSDAFGCSTVNRRDVDIAGTGIQLSERSRLAFDGRDAVLLTDYSNAAVHVFASNGVYRHKLLSAADGVKQPCGIAVDSEGRLLYLGLDNGSLLVFLLSNCKLIRESTLLAHPKPKVTFC